MSAIAPPEARKQVWRYNFWKVAEAAVPELWLSLLSEVFPTYQRAWTDPAAQRSYSDSLMGAYKLHGRIREGMTPPVLQYLSKVLLDWQKKWNLLPEWCEMAALYQLHFWLVVPEYEGRFLHAHGWGGYVPELQPPELPAWDAWTSWESYEERVITLLRAHRDPFLKDLEAQGWETLEFGRKGVPERNLKWLALTVLKGLSVEQIEEKEGWAGSSEDKISTIQKAIRTMSERIDLPIPGERHG